MVWWVGVGVGWGGCCPSPRRSRPVVAHPFFSFDSPSLASAVSAVTITSRGPFQSPATTSATLASVADAVSVRGASGRPATVDTSMRAPAAALSARGPTAKALVAAVAAPSQPSTTLGS